jgi:hypothetical protein
MLDIIYFRILLLLENNSGIATTFKMSIPEFILETGNSSNMNPGADEFPV